MKGYCTVRIPETVYKICNNCDYLKYNHDWDWQIPKYECKLSDKVELEELYGNVETPSNCPILKEEQDDKSGDN